MDALEQTPRLAIEAFERVTGLAVVIHDLAGMLTNVLPAARFIHHSPYCRAAKAQCLQNCTRFCVTQTRQALQNKPDGRAQICHAGLVEFVVPRTRGQTIDWVLFAGQRGPGKTLEADWDIQPRSKRPWSRHLRPLEAIEADEAARLLEMTRQLAARLDQWQGAMERSIRADGVPPEGRAQPPDLSMRRQMILRFVAQQHGSDIRVRDLAQLLHLSESRAIHAVREACGTSFVKLLVRARIKSACAMLRYTELPVTEVAARCGFRDLSHFHYSFRRHVRKSPLEYRAAMNRRRAV